MLTTHDQKEWDPARHTKEKLRNTHSSINQLSLHSSVEIPNKIEAILENQRQQNT